MGIPQLRIVFETYDEEEFDDLPPKIRNQISYACLKRETLEESNPNDILNAATTCPYATKIINKWYGLRWIAMRKKGPGERHRLFPHQIEALKWMRERERTKSKDVRGGILCMMMGLGKTLTAVAHTISSPRGDTPTLIVCGKSVMLEWRADIRKFFGDKIKILFLHKDMMGKYFEKITYAEILKYEMIITTYDVVLNTSRKKEFFIERALDRDAAGRVKTVSEVMGVTDESAIGPDLLFSVAWHRVITDESQRFANFRTRTYQAIMGIEGKYKWCLTGTPIRNYMTDLFSIFRFCGYKNVTKPREWSKYIYEYDRLDLAIFRMNYDDAGIIIPPRMDVDINVYLENEEKRCYKYFEAQTKDTYQGMMLGSITFASVLAMFTRLRQVCIAPFLVCPESKITHVATEDEKQADMIIQKALDQLTGGLGTWIKCVEGTAGMKSAKVTAIIDVLSKIPPNEKILIFTTFTSALDLLRKTIQHYLPEFGVCQIDGRTTGRNREEVLHEFKCSDEKRALLMTYKVGSEGLNLTEANHVICIEPWWCPSVHEQAKARCHRFGQTRNVHIYNINVVDSIETTMIRIVNETKLELASSVLKGTNKRVGKLDKYTLGRILGIY